MSVPASKYSLKWRNVQSPCRYSCNLRMLTTCRRCSTISCSQGGEFNYLQLTSQN